jgi:SPP1 family predicted phage head-tail adaptor
MRAGTLRHSIDIEVASSAVDSFGDTGTTWSAVYSGVRASITPLRGTQQDQARAVNNKTSHTIRLRYLPGIYPHHRIKFDGRYFDIHSIVDISERERWLEIMAVEHG